MGQPSRSCQDNGGVSLTVGGTEEESM